MKNYLQHSVALNIIDFLLKKSIQIFSTKRGFSRNAEPSKETDYHTTTYFKYQTNSLTISFSLINHFLNSMKKVSPPEDGKTFLLLYNLVNCTSCFSFSRWSCLNFCSFFSYISSCSYYISSLSLNYTSSFNFSNCSSN